MIGEEPAATPTLTDLCFSIVYSLLGFQKTLSLDQPVGRMFVSWFYAGCIVVELMPSNAIELSPIYVLPVKYHLQLAKVLT